MKTIDLRSDTVTRPSAEMRRAMLEAEVGDDVLGDDPTVIRLQEHAAGLLGKEAGLYFPSGTMCNQAAVRALTRRGDEAFLHAQAHIMFYEQGGASALSNVQLRCFDSPDGTLDLEKMDEYVHTDADVHWAPTRLVCLENTHNHCGGIVVPIAHVRAVRELCDRHDLRMHLDGARLFNAVAASDFSAAEYAAAFDTVSICLSKGLGAPVAAGHRADRRAQALGQADAHGQGGGVLRRREVRRSHCIERQAHVEDAQVVPVARARASVVVGVSRQTRRVGAPAAARTRPSSRGRRAHQAIRSSATGRCSAPRPRPARRT